MSFPCVFKHTIGREGRNKSLLIVSPNISGYLNERIFSSIDDIHEFDDDEISKYKFFRQKNYPMRRYRPKGIFSRNNITIKNGRLDNKHTYIGEYMAHTFLDYFTTHHFLRTSEF